jgi:hypothetical protein
MAPAEPAAPPGKAHGAKGDGHDKPGKGKGPKIKD